MDTTLKKLRYKALKTFREYEAINVLINEMTTDIRKVFDNYRAKIKQSNKRDLRTIIPHLENEIDTLRKKYEVTATHDKLVELLSKIEVYQ